MPEKTLSSLLAGGDRRSIGQADRAASRVARHPEDFGQLILCLWDSDPVISMRAADAAEKVSRSHPELLQPYKAELLGLAAETLQKGLRWHLAQMVPRLALAMAERQRTVELLKLYLDDRSSIVKTCAMQALAELAIQDPALRPEIKQLLHVHTRSGTAAMRARGRKLLELRPFRDV